MYNILKKALTVALLAGAAQSLTACVVYERHPHAVYAAPAPVVVYQPGYWHRY